MRIPFSGRRARPARRLRGPRPSLERLDRRQLLAGGPLGINAVLPMYGDEYVDMIKSSTGFLDQNGNPSYSNDAQGWPQTDSAVGIFDDSPVRTWPSADTSVWSSADPSVSFDRGGDYHLSFRGQADVTFFSNLRGRQPATDVSYDPTTNTTTGTVSEPHGDTFLALYFDNSRRTPDSPAGSGVTDVRLIQPGYDPGTAQLFSTPYLNALAPFDTLRYMDALGANGYDASWAGQSLEWQQRATPDQATHVNAGVVASSPWEDLIELANATHTNMWINIPGPASDGYVRQLAGLIKHGDTVDGVSYPGLDPGLKVYVEWSNETWGGINAPWAYNMAVTQPPLEAGTSILNNDGADPSSAWSIGGSMLLRNDMLRTEQIATIFNQVFDDPDHDTIRPVVVWQEGNIQPFVDSLAWFESNFGAPGRYFYGIGQANYYGPSDYSSVDNVISETAASAKQANQATLNFTTLATYYGLKNVAYEGGPAMSAYDPDSQAVLLQALHDPRLEQVVAQSYIDWFANGGDQAEFYNGPYGGWNAMFPWGAAPIAYENDPSLSPKYAGLMDAIDSAPIPVTAGVAVGGSDPTSFDANTDTMGTWFNSNMTQGNQNGYWLLNVARAGTYELSVDSTSPAEYRISTPMEFSTDGDAGLGPTITIPPGAGSTNLGAVTLHAGLNTLYVHTPTVAWGFWANTFTLIPLDPPAVPGAGFELAAGLAPSAIAGSWGDFRYDPAGTPWSFAGAAGVSGNGSGFTGGNPDAPEGSQVAFLQGDGSFSQSVNYWPAGTYQISFDAAQRANSQASRQDFAVLVDGVIVDSFTPTGTDYATYTTAPFTVGAGSHTITFEGLDSAGGDNTAFVDAVRVAAAQPPSEMADAGFEAPAVGNGSWGDFRYDPAGTPWSFAGAAGVSGNGSGFTGGNPDAPEGSQVAFLQGDGSFSQSVSGLSAGWYTISFDAAQRANSQASRQDFAVLVDGVIVGSFTPTGTDYATYTTAPFTVGAGSHTITFEGLDSAGGDNTAFVDAVRVAAAQPPSEMADAGFEAPAVGNGSWGDFRYDPAGTPWSFAGAAGVSGNGSGFTGGNPDAPEGSQVAFLQGDGSFSQSVSGLSAGWYTISFDAAQRANSQASRQDFAVLVDGVIVGSFTPTGTDYATYTTAPFTVGAGSHTITFEGLDSAGGDNTAFVDAVRVAAAQPPSEMADAGFEAPAVGNGSWGDFRYDPAGTPWSWSFAGAAGVSGNGSGFTGGNPDAPEGSQVAFLQGDGSFSQSVNYWPAGTYQISFDAAQRANSQASRQDFAVLVDGVIVDSFTPTGTDYATYTTAPFTVGAGSHTITFEGLDSAGGDNTAFVDAVRLAYV